MKKKVLCLVLSVCFALCLFAGCSGGNSEKATPADVSQADFYKLAYEQRFDYVPLFDEGNAPTSTADYLMYAFVLDDENIKAQSEGNAQMSKAYVESVVTTHFELDAESLKHRPMLHTWEYDAETETYTAIPGGYNEEAAYKLVSVTAENKNGKAVYTVVATPVGIEELWYLINAPVDFENEFASKELSDFHALLKDSGVYKDGMTYSDAILALFEAGKGDELPDTKRTDTFKYYVDEEGNVVFLAHEVAFEAPVTHGGVAVEEEAAE